MLSKLSAFVLASFATGSFAGKQAASIHEDAIFGNELPNAILEMESRIPAHEYSEEGEEVVFQIPQKIRRQLLDDEPQEYLTGACLQTYQGYKDGRRLHEMANLLGPDTLDMIVEFVLYDFVLNDCAWMDADTGLWGCSRNDWTYIDLDRSPFLKELQSDHAFLVTEVTDWFSYWIEMESKEGAKIYADSIIQWKVAIIQKFLSLKELPEIVSHMPSLVANEPIKRRKKHVQVLARRLGANKNVDLDFVEQLQADEGKAAEKNGQGCGHVNPVAHFGDRWAHIEHFLRTAHEMDVLSALKSRNGRNGGKKAGKNVHSADYVNNGVDSTFTLVTEVCEGVCIRIGAGFTYNYKLQSASIDWSYGMGTQRPMVVTESGEDTDVSVKINLNVRCDASSVEEKKLMNDQTTVSYGKMVPNTDMEYSIITDASSEDVIGFGYTIGVGTTNIMGDFVEKDDVGFFYGHSGQMARYTPDTPNGRCPNNPDKEAQLGLKIAGQKIKKHHVSGSFGSTNPMVLFFAMVGLIALLSFVCKFVSNPAAHKEVNEATPLLGAPVTDYQVV